MRSILSIFEVVIGVVYDVLASIRAANAEEPASRKTPF